jgi:hypothetical protein
MSLICEMLVVFSDTYYDSSVSVVCVVWKSSCDLMEHITRVKRRPRSNKHSAESLDTFGNVCNKTLIRYR